MRFLLFSILLTFSQQALSQQLSHGAYGLFPLGSIRVIGMGGAFAALSNDASGIHFNPAGLAHGNWKYDVGGSSSRIDNRESGNAGEATGNGLPYSSQFYSAAMKLSKNFVFGLGLSSPYDLEVGGEDGHALNVLSGDLLLAYRLGSFSFGVTGHYEKASLKFTETQSFEEESTIYYPTLGFNYRKDKFGLGVAYTPERTHDIDENANNQLTNQVWFRDVVIPAKLTVGLFYQYSKNLIFVVDVDQIDAPKDSIFVGTGVSGDASGERLLEEKKLIIHGGGEYTLIQSKKTEVRMQFGGYQEPSRLASSEERAHLTLGAEVRFGPVTLGVTYDQAKGFQNTAASFGLSLGSI